MNLTRLEYFLTLAQTGNLRRASEILRVTPPALSKAMNVLEDELEVKLWMRDGRAITLTDAGKKLLREIPNILEPIRNIKERINEDHQKPKILKLGTFEVFSTYFLRFLSDRCIQSQRLLETLELHELLPGEIERFVAEGLLDFGLTYMPVPYPELDLLKVTEIEMGVFVKRGSFQGIKQDDLPFVVPVAPLQGVPTRVRGLDGWPEDAYTRKILHRVTLLESALQLCREGRVAGYFPAFIVEEHNRQVLPQYRLERKKSPYPGRVCVSEVFLVKRKSTRENESTKLITSVLRSLR